MSSARVVEASELRRSGRGRGAGTGAGAGAGAGGDGWDGWPARHLSDVPRCKRLVEGEGPHEDIGHLGDLRRCGLRARAGVWVTATSREGAWQG